MPAKKPQRRAPLKRKTPLRPSPLSRGGARTRGLTTGIASEKGRGARALAPAPVAVRPRRSSSAAPNDRAGSADDPRAPRPFVKWAGGKRQLLDKIRRYLPERFNTYHEPFVGGGAVFFALSAGRPAHLSDSNERLVRAYRGIKDSVGDVIAILRGHEQDRRSREAYLKMRARDIDSDSDAEVAAWFIYLNKLAFNGLYRVNSKNRFNVPYGDNENAVLCDERNLRACAEALARADLHHEDFTAVAERARAGDLVYFDPPYFPVSVTSYFTSYTVGGFTPDDQRKLRDLAQTLKRKRVHVLLSNSPPAAALYTEDLGFSVTEVLASRAVNSKAELRGKITELLIR